jgi:hypothetical protein
MKQCTQVESVDPCLRAAPETPVFVDVAQIFSRNAGARRMKRFVPDRINAVVRLMLPRFKNTTAQLDLLAFNQAQPS